MRYTVTIREQDYEQLYAHLFSDASTERAAYLLCRSVNMVDETRLLTRKWIPVESDHIVSSSRAHMKISSRSYTRAMKEANDRKECLFFVHSHPDGPEQHSLQDDEEEEKLFRTMYVRIRTTGVHGSLVFTRAGITSARIWKENSTRAPIELLRIIGRRFRYWFSDQPHIRVPDFFDRQVRAFGRDIQAILSRLNVGIVGVGGTGSAVAEQLIRLGVGSCVLADGGLFEPSNINRVYGSRLVDADILKVKITERLAADVGINTRVKTIPRPISYRSVISQFRNCDVIFCCTDDEWGRSILTKFAIYYLIPVFDMGVKIDSQNGTIRSIQGRVTTLLPGSACLFCRDRITARRVRAESLRALDSEQAVKLEREGYIPELEEPAPAVVPFTTMIASSAVSEFLHRLTGFLGDERESSEVIHLIDDTRTRTNNKPSKPDCFCADETYFGRGDVNPSLDLTWRPE
jgi:molybdopterin/thiamine biosynthesis adenylyltransferase